MPQNFAFSANSAKFAIFVRNLWYFHKISRFLLNFFQEILKYRNYYRNKFIVNNLITCDRFVYCSGFMIYFIICQQKLHYIIIPLQKMVNCWNFDKEMQKIDGRITYARFRKFSDFAAKFTRNFAKFSEPCRKISRNLPQISEVLNYDTACVTRVCTGTKNMHAAQTFPVES